MLVVSSQDMRMKPRKPNGPDLMNFLAIIERTLRSQLEHADEQARAGIVLGMDALEALQDAAKGMMGVVGEIPGVGASARELAMEEIVRRPRLGRAWTPRPVFVIGYRRSGTTLICWLLDSHPELACLPENPLCRAMFEGQANRMPQLLQAGSMLRWVLGESRPVFFGRCAQLVADVFGAYAERQGKRRWVSKELFIPHVIDLLDMAFDYQSQFVYVVRHGLDAAFSASERFELLDAAKMASGLGLRNYLDEWRQANDALAGFAARNADRCLTVRYEDFVADPAVHAQRLCAFLDLDWVPTLLDDMREREHPSLGDSKIHETGGRVERGRQGRWREWPEALIQELAVHANPTLERLGYEPVPTSSARSAALAL
jgi:protein-tyrosine sulfotransferase